MYANSFPPLTFDDLTKAIQRESWGPSGLGQVTCPDGSTAPDTLSCLPVDSSAQNAALNAVVTSTAAAAEQPYYQTVFGMQIPTSTLVIGGILALVAVGIAMGGRR